MASNSDKNKMQRIILLIIAGLVIIAVAFAYFLYTFLTSNIQVEVKEPEVIEQIIDQSISKNVNDVQIEETKSQENVQGDQLDESQEEELEDAESAIESDAQDVLEEDEEEINVDEVQFPEHEPSATMFIVTEIITKGDNYSKLEEEIRLSHTSMIDQMPNRDFIKRSPFTVFSDDQILTLTESTFKEVKEEAEALAGSRNPFKPKSRQSGHRTTWESTGMNLPEVNLPPDLDSLIDSSSQTSESGRINLPPELEQIDISGLEDTIVPKIKFSDKASSDKQELEVVLPSVSDDFLARIILTGIIDNQVAVIKINGVSRALRVGESFRGIQVVSVNQRQVTLRVGGRTVIKNL